MPKLRLVAATMLLAAASVCGAGRPASTPASGPPPQSGVEAAAVHAAEPAGAVESARLTLAAGADITLTAHDGAGAGFAGLPSVEATPAGTLAVPARLEIMYDEAFVAAMGARESDLALYAREDETWRRLDATLDLERDRIWADVTELTSWAVAPPWLMTSWQARMLLGAPFVEGERNVLILHGWNSSPWDGCQLQLAAAMSAHYDNVLTYAYPSALDIAANARWLRHELRRAHPGTTFDMIGFSEGGLIARAAIESGALNDNDAIASAANVFLIATPNLGLPANLPPSPMGDVASRQMAAGSGFLRDLNAAGPDSARYYAIAGDAIGASDGVVAVQSALGDGALALADAAVLPLPHAPGWGSDTWLPCDGRVYDAIAGWLNAGAQP